MLINRQSYSGEGGESSIFKREAGAMTRRIHSVITQDEDGRFSLNMASKHERKEEVASEEKPRENGARGGGIVGD